VTRVEAAGDDTVLDALRRAGWRSPYKCRRGGCGVCKARLLRGELRYARPVAETVLSPDERAHGMCLPCRAIPTTDVVIELDGAPLRAVLATVTSPTTPHGQQGD
jgi:CDP-4-dehydro-6-deoxyglucose reductase